MGGLIQPSPVSTEERSSTWRPVLIGVAIVVVVVGVIVFAMRETPRARTGPPPYASELKISDLKMSAAESFVGAEVDGIRIRASSLKDVQGQQFIADDLSHVILENEANHNMCNVLVTSVWHGSVQRRK